MKKKLGEFTIWNLFTIISIVLISFLTLPLYINNLPPSSFAVLSLIWSTLSVSSILDFGLGRSITRELSVLENLNDRTKQSLMISTGLGTALILSFIAAILVYLILVLYFLFFANNLILNSTTIVYISITVFFTILNNVFLSMLEGVHLIRVSSIFKILFTLFFFGTPAVLIYCKLLNNLEEVVLVILISKLIQSVLSITFLRIRFSISLFKFSLNQSKVFFKLGKWLTLSNISSILMTHSDRFIIGYYLSPIKLVNYSVAADLIQRGSGLFSVLPNSLLPIISHSDKSEYKMRNIQFVFILMLVIVSVACCAGFLSIDLILKLWLKQSYNIEISNLFKIMLLSWYGSSFGQLFLTRLHSVGDTKSASLVHLFESLIFIPGIIIGLKFYGLIGGAIVVTLRSLIDSMLLWKIANKYE